MAKHLNLGFEHHANPDSIERAFTHHGIPEGYRGWQRHPDGGWLVTTGIGVLRLRNLRDGALFVVGLAEKGRLLDATVADGAVVALDRNR